MSLHGIFHFSRPKVYDLIHDEGLPVIHFGRAARVSPASLLRWLARREQVA
jgi:excisionase family DNA binding protein